MQADGLSQILADMATKDDLLLLKADLTSEMRQGFAQMRTEMHEALASYRSDMHEALGTYRAEMHKELGTYRAEMHRELALSRAESVRANEQLRTDLSDAIAKIQASTLRWVITLIIALTSIFTLLEVLID